MKYLNDEEVKQVIGALVMGAVNTECFSGFIADDLVAQIESEHKQITAAIRIMEAEGVKAGDLSTEQLTHMWHQAQDQVVSGRPAPFHFYDAIRAALSAPAAAVEKAKPSTHEAVQRIQAYINRRKQSRGIDHEHIHGFDIGPDCGVELLLSDIEALITAPIEQAPVAVEGELPEPVAMHAPAGPDGDKYPVWHRGQVLDAIRAAVLAEREAAAIECDKVAAKSYLSEAKWCATAIRNRTTKEQA